MSEEIKPTQELNGLSEDKKPLKKEGGWTKEKLLLVGFVTMVAVCFLTVLCLSAIFGDKPVDSEPSGVVNTEENKPAVVQKDFIVSFDANGAEISGDSLSCEIVEGSCTVTAPMITRDGYKVLGWATSPDGTDVIAPGELITLTGNTKYYAITEKKAEEPEEKLVYKATFKKNGAAKVGSGSLTCEYGDEDSCTIKAPSITREGFKIAGWSDSVDGGDEIKAGEEITLTGDATYYAITNKKVTATFKKNGATQIGEDSLSCTIKNAATTCSVTAPSISRDKPYTVKGWATSASATSASVNVGSKIKLTADTKYYAISEQSVKATFVRNGATKIGDGTVNIVKSCVIRNTATSCKVTTPTITRNNGIVMGWASFPEPMPGGDGSIHINAKAGASMDVAFSGTYSAITGFRVTFKRNGNAVQIGGGTADTITVDCTATSGLTSCSVVAPAIAIVPGNNYAVKGWHTNSNSRTPNNSVSMSSCTLPGDHITASGNITYYAHVMWGMP